MKRTILIAFVFLASCSTIDRRTFYSPVEDQSATLSTQKLYCGITQSSGKPDSISFNGIKYQINYTYKPYFWGPWLVTVVPVFPVTLFFDYEDKNIELAISSINESDIQVGSSNVNVLLSYENGEGELITLYPKNVSYAHKTTFVTFPIEFKYVDHFTLVTQENKKIEFSKQKKWSWTQICVN